MLESDIEISPLVLLHPRTRLVFIGLNDGASEPANCVDASQHVVGNVDITAMSSAHPAHHHRRNDDDGILVATKSGIAPRRSRNKDGRNIKVWTSR